MSRPKIYANCKAGCPWETIHRDEFERSATLAEVIPAFYSPMPDGSAIVQYTLAVDKRYKIILGESGFTASISSGSGAVSLDLTPDEYKKYSVVEILKTHITRGTAGANSNATFTAECIYEVNGERRTKDEEIDNRYDFDLNNLSIHITCSNDLKVYVYNDSAEIFSAGLPQFTASDEGKVLVYKDGKVTTQNASELTLSEATVRELIETVITEKLEGEY